TAFATLKVRAAAATPKAITRATESEKPRSRASAREAIRRSLKSSARNRLRGAFASGCRAARPRRASPSRTGRSASRIPWASARQSPILSSATRHASSGSRASSSTTSASRRPGRSSGGRCSRTSRFQSAMTDLRHGIESEEELPPAAAVSLERPLSARGQTIEPPPPLARFFDPPARDQLLGFEPIEQWIERGRLELEPSFRALGDQARDLVAVARAPLDQGQHEERRAPLLHRLNVEIRDLFHAPSSARLYVEDIYMSDTGQA